MLTDRTITESAVTIGSAARFRYFNLSSNHVDFCFWRQYIKFCKQTLKVKSINQSFIANTIDTNLLATSEQILLPIC